MRVAGDSHDCLLDRNQSFVDTQVLQKEIQMLMLMQKRTVQSVAKVGSN